MANDNPRLSGTLADELNELAQQIGPGGYETYDPGEEDEIDRLMRWADEHGECGDALQAEWAGEV